MRKLISMSLLGLGLCVASASAAQAKNIEVVTSFSILKDMVQNVGGKHVDVHSLIGPDGDAHEYEPSPADVKKLSKAQVFMVNGAGLDAWSDRLIKASGFKGQAVTATNGVKLMTFEEEGIENQESHHDDHAAHDDEHDHDHGDLDPHAWQNPYNAMVYVKNIEAGLAKADPANAKDYAANAKAYSDKIAAQAQAIKKQLSVIPAANRKMVTTHDAFAYYGKAFDIGLISVLGITTSAEPSAKEVARIIDLIKKDKVPAVFFENIKNPSILKQIASESGAKVGGTLYSDALAPSGEASTYLGMLAWNTQKLLEALK